jgi:hypothetical protein
VGVPGPGLAGAGPTVGVPTVTAAKPESKLWFHAGSWWGSLWSAGAQAFHIHRLDATTHAWVDTGAVIEDRPDSHSDALWDGTKLYIGSHEFSQGVGGDPNDPLLVARYSFAGGTYTLDAGFPVTIGDGATETMVIAKDSTGTLWAVWKASLRVFFSHTMGSDTTWSAPAILPVNTTDFDSDDICSVIAFSGNQIGVMWSDRVQNSFLFTTHADGAPDTSWSPVEFALAGEWDDHLNLKADSTGRVFAVVKNSGEDVKLLVRAAGGGWTQHLVDDGSLVDLTRPIVLLDEVARQLHVFASVGGTIQRKSTSLDAISFTIGAGTVVIDADLAVNNATSTKQNVTPSTGFVVLAANESTTGTYWHHEVPAVPTGNGLVFGPIDPGVAGANNTFTVTGCTPNKLVAVYGGLVLGSSTITMTQCPAGVQIGLGSPYRRLGIVRANAAGVASLTVFASATTAGKLFHFQAVEAFSCRASNIVDERM